MSAGTDSAKMRQRHADTDRAVAAHADRADIVEENHARRAGRIARLAQQCADEHVRSARLADDGRAEFIEPLAKDRAAFEQRTIAKIGGAFDDNTRRLAPGVRIDNVNSLAEQLAVHGWAVGNSGRRRGKPREGRAESIQ